MNWSSKIILISLIITIITIVVNCFNKLLKKEEALNKTKINHQKELLKKSIEIQENERKRIAENLHDDIIPQLYRIKLTNLDPKINKMIKEGISTTRTISHLLNPPLLEDTPIEDLIKDFLEPYKNTYQISLILNCNEIVKNHTKLNIYRIFQEIITNCNKHAKAETIEINLKTSKKRICLLIRDNGVGINLSNKKGMGLKNIEIRVQILNGICKFKTCKNKGTCFILLVNNEK